MKFERRTIAGDIRLDFDLTLYGTVTGSVTVVEDGFLLLYGTCNQNVILENKSKAYIYGTVVGNALNNGGYLEIYGTINGFVKTSNEGNTKIDPYAVIRQALQ
jgi:cytoskeletal protein CcmA (bactofilin family)